MSQIKGSRRSVWHPVAAVLLILAVVGVARAYPTPASVPFRWQLDFEPGELRLYEDGANGAYWFFSYQVTNRTGRQQIWAPLFTLFTDRGEIIASGRDVPATVLEDLIDLLGNELLERQNEVIGEILPGKEHAKEGLIIWPATELDVNEISLFIAGVSGETARVTNPITGEEVLMRKTLQRDYLVRGDALPRGRDPVELVSERWILR